MPQFKLDEPRIATIIWPNADMGSDFLTVGQRGITKITHREQYCGDSSIHWLEAWKGDKLFARYNAANVDTILYDEEC